MDWTNDILPKITISVKKKPVNDGTVQFIGFRGGGKKAINNLYKPIKILIFSLLREVVKIKHISYH